MGTDSGTNTQGNRHVYNIKDIKILNYNVHGLFDKLDNLEFVNYLRAHDIICLTETFIGYDFESSHFKDYKIFTSKAQKLSHRGRHSGGVILMVKKSYEDFIEEIKIRIDNILVLKLHKDLFSVNTHVMLICCYVPPYDSPYWKCHTDSFGIELLEQCVIDLYAFHGDFPMLICGDLNSRTASMNYCSDVDISDLEQSQISNDNTFPRESQDSHVNVFGEQLLDFCNVFDCVILNGLCESEFDNSYTFIAAAGTSTVDYFISSCELLSNVHFGSLLVESETYSDHLPIVMTLEIGNVISADIDKTLPSADSEFEKIIWNDEREDEYVKSLETVEIQNRLIIAAQTMDVDIDHALDIFVNCLKDASRCMLKSFSSKRIRKKKSEWFDGECVEAKKDSRCKLNRFRRSREEIDRLMYIEAKKKYKRLLKEKKTAFRKQQTEKLAADMTNSSLFWKQLRNLGCGGKQTMQNNVELNEWLNHFKNVFQGNTEEFCETNTIETDLSEDPDHFLNKVISEEEVSEAVSKLKKGKASGIDDVSAEMLKSGGKYIGTFLTKLFNVIFERGIYPQEWSKAIIIPIYKKGDPENVDNYRGVSLLSIISKCYTTILNTRLYAWLEENNLISESQAGFRKQYSTVDHIFTLYATIQKCVNRRKGKLYVAFVDFRKAFDSVKHDKLIECLKNEGIKGRFFAALKAMYDSLLSCVRSKNNVSEMFDCPTGVRQGCVLSPTLFSLFINQVANQVEQEGKHGVKFLPGIMELFILLFADDVALLSTTPVGLQNQLNVLQSCCSRMKLCVNIDKTKVMVFRKGGFLGKRERWYFEGRCLEVVNSYCYLGFNFTTMISIKKGTEHLVVKGKKASIQLCKLFRTFKEMSPNVFFKIFDVKIQPILLYSAELWGLNRLDHIEKVHLMICKRFLGVPVKTPNKMVYGDLGRYPLFVNSYVACLRYWFKLLQLDCHRLPKKAYLMLLDLDKGGKQCWVSRIREILCETGFGIVWLQQGVGEIKGFLSVFKQRLIDMFFQEWSGTIRDSNRYELYRQFKTVFVREKYVTDVDTYCFRVAISQLRCNVLPLNNNMYRYGDCSQKKNCPFCAIHIEDEVHFLFHCPLYNDLRNKFLKESATVPLHVLLQLTNDFHTHNISRYVFHAINKRKKAILKLKSES